MRTVRVVSLVFVLLLLGASGGAVSASHDPAYPSESFSACGNTAAATPGFRHATWSPFTRTCTIYTNVVTTSVATAHGFSATVHYTAGQITYRTLFDGTHQFTDTRVATVLACVTPGGKTLPSQAAANNPNCYPPGS